MFLETDVRDTLPLIRTPTLVMQRRGDLAVNYRAARWLADQIEGSRYVELEGVDHFPWVADQDGRALEEIEDFLTGVRPGAAVERVLATVLFTDIVDSTRLAGELGDSRWRRLLEDHQALTREPASSASRAARSRPPATASWRPSTGRPGRSSAPGRSPSTMPPLGVEVRAGLHAGEVELMGDDVGGIAVHVAARISALAGAGEVLASRTVRDLASGSGIVFESLGRHALKGVADEWDVYRIGATPLSGGTLA